MSTKTHHNQTSNEKEQQTTRVERKRQQQGHTIQPEPTEALQRVTNAPPSAMRPVDILALQSSVGNRAVQCLVDGDPGVIQRHMSERLREELLGSSGWMHRLDADIRSYTPPLSGSLVDADIMGLWSAIRRAAAEPRESEGGGAR